MGRWPAVLAPLSFVGGAAHGLGRGELGGVVGGAVRAPGRCEPGAAPDEGGAAATLDAFRDGGATGAPGRGTLGAAPAAGGAAEALGGGPGRAVSTGERAFGIPQCGRAAWADTSEDSGSKPDIGSAAEASGGTDILPDSGAPALQGREATAKQVLDILRKLGATSPLEVLKAAGLVDATQSAQAELDRRRALAQKIHIYRAANMSVVDIAGCTGLAPAAVREFLKTPASP